MFVEMARATNDAFLTSMTKMMATAKEKGVGAVSITLKRNVPKPPKGADPSATPQAPTCLIRAKRGKRKATTVVDSKNAAKFQRSFGVILTVQTNDFKVGDKKKKTKKAKTDEGKAETTTTATAATTTTKTDTTKPETKKQAGTKAGETATTKTAAKAEAKPAVAKAEAPKTTEGKETKAKAEKATRKS